MPPKSNDGKSTCRLSGGGRGRTGALLSSGLSSGRIPSRILPSWPTVPSNNLPAPAADTPTIFSASVTAAEKHKRKILPVPKLGFFFPFLFLYSAKQKIINSGVRFFQETCHSVQLGAPQRDRAAAGFRVLAGFYSSSDAAEGGRVGVELRPHRVAFPPTTTLLPSAHLHLLTCLP